MTSSNRLAWVTVTIFILLLIIPVVDCAGAAQKVNFPTRPITYIVPYAPAGGADIPARAYAEGLKTVLPRPVEVVNKPGGNCIPGFLEMMNSKPDGHTIIMGATNTLLTSALLFKDSPIKGAQDVQPVITGAIIPMVFAVNADAPWKTMKNFMDYARTNPGKIKVAIATLGGSTQVHFTQMIRETKLDMGFVPNDGAGPAVLQLLGGHVQAAVLNITPLIAQVKAGKVRVLAVFLPERMKDLPDAQTFKELGYPNVITEGNTYFVCAPLNTPKEVITILYDAFKKVQQTDRFKKFASDNSFVFDDHGTDWWVATLKEQQKFYDTFLKEAGFVK